MKLKTLALLLLICLLAAPLSACNSGLEPESSVSNTESVSTAPSNSGVTNSDSIDGSPADTDNPDETDSPAQEDKTALAAYELPFTAENVTFTYWCTGASPTVASTLGADKSYNTSDATLYLNDLLGINIKYVENDMMSSREKFNLMIISGDYCDMISGFEDMYPGGGQIGFENDIIIELTNLIENMLYYSSYLEENPSYDKLARSDSGQRFFIASFCDENFTQQGGCVRQDWLDALGLQAPETYDELTAVAEAFYVEYGCSSTIYLSKDYNPMVNFSGGLDLPGFSFSSTGSEFYQIADKIQCAYVRDEFKDMITLIKSWWDLNLISPDFFVLQGGGDAQTYINNSQVGICWNRAESITDYNEQLKDTGFMFTGFPNLVSEKGQVTHFSPAQAGITATVSVSVTCENLDLLAKWFDYGFTDDGILWGNYGMEGYSYIINDTGEPEFTEAMFDHNVGFKQSSERYIRYGAPTIVDVDCGFTGIYDDIGYDAITVWNQGFDGAYDLPVSLAMTAEESETFSALINDIETYVQQWVMKATVGEIDLDTEWNSYVEMLYSLGLQECIDIKQASYDRFLAR